MSDKPVCLMDCHCATHRQQVGALFHLTESGDTVEVEGGDGFVLVLHKSEGLEGEMCDLRHPVHVQLCLPISGTSGTRECL